MTSLDELVRNILAIKQQRIAKPRVNPINEVVSRVGGSKTISYLKVLDELSTTWSKMVHECVDARVTWGVVIGAGIGGPSINVDISSTYLYGSYHAWPLYTDNEDTRQGLNELIKTLVYGIQAILGIQGDIDGRRLDEVVGMVRGTKLSTRIQNIRTIKGQNPTGVAETLSALSKEIDISSPVWSNPQFNVPAAIKVNLNGQEGGLNTYVDNLLFLAWSILGQEISTYTPGILGGIFPILCSGQNARPERISRLIARVNEAFDITERPMINDSGVGCLWGGCKDILKPAGRARAVSWICTLLGDAVQSTWISVFGRRMQYYGLASVIMVATAIAHFPNAGWSNFFEINQEEYTAHSLDITRDNVNEWLEFVEAVADMVSLPFRISEFKEATIDDKIGMVVLAFKAVRPSRPPAEWKLQGHVCLEIFGDAISDPYHMYTGKAGRTRDIGDLAYYSFLLLKDVARQASLEGFRNSLASYSQKPTEVEALVSSFKKLIGTFPGSRGVIEMQKTELPRLLAVMTADDDYDFDQPTVERISQNLESASTTLRGISAGSMVVPSAPLPPLKGPNTAAFRSQISPPRQ